MEEIAMAAISQERKQEIIAKFRTHESDTGSPEVQIAVLTAEIDALTEHLNTHKKITQVVVDYLKKFSVVVTY